MSKWKWLASNIFFKPFFCLRNILLFKKAVPNNRTELTWEMNSCLSVSGNVFTSFQATNLPMFTSLPMCLPVVTCNVFTSVCMQFVYQCLHAICLPVSRHYLECRNDPQAEPIWATYRKWSTLYQNQPVTITKEAKNENFQPKPKSRNQN